MTRFHALMSMSVLMAMGTTATATATTHVLRPDGSGDFATIQAAVSAAVDGDAIELENGVYVGPGSRDIDVEGKAITIRSQSGDAEACVLDCQGTAADRHRGFVFDSDEGLDTVLEGIAVANGYVQCVNGGAILCFDSSPTIRSCLFLGNVAPEGGGIACEGSTAFPVISQCRFVENHATNGGALTACSEASPQLIQCTFAQNFANEGGAVRLCYGSASIDECTFYANAALTGSAIASESGHELAITNTIIAINVQGSAVSCSDEIVLAVSCCDVFGNPGRRLGRVPVGLVGGKRQCLRGPVVLRPHEWGSHPRLQFPLRYREQPGLWPDRGLARGLRSDPGGRSPVGAGSRRCFGEHE